MAEHNPALPAGPAPIFKPERARIATAVLGERHGRSASFLPLTNHHDRVLNANGEEVARCESNHNAMLLVLLANAGAGVVFGEKGKS